MRTINGLEVRFIDQKRWMMPQSCHLTCGDEIWWTGKILDAAVRVLSMPKVDSIHFCESDLPLVEAAFKVVP